jgi:hypothetical protein
MKNRRTKDKGNGHFWNMKRTQRKGKGWDSLGREKI